jgi:hypothetical protein
LLIRGFVSLRIKYYLFFMHIIKYNLKIFVFIILFFSCLLFVSSAKAEILPGQIVVQPEIIDDQAKAKEIREYQIIVKNTSSTTISLYPLVTDLKPEGGEPVFTDPTNLDKSISLARWINFKRSGIELSAGQEAEVPLKIDVNMNALPGTYHAVIIFGYGASQAEAQERAGKEKLARLLINFTVKDEIIEKAQLVSFNADKNIFFSFPVSFLLEVRNVGNSGVAPAGMIRIYDRRGQEVGSLPVNEEKKDLTPETNARYQVKWNKNSGFGKYKAKLDMEYGEKSIRDMNDALYFWVLPWKIVAIVLLGVFILLVVLIILLSRILSPKADGQRPSNGVINLKK